MDKFITGIYPSSFTAKDSGEVINGFWIEFGYPVTDERGCGTRTSDKVFVSVKKMNSEYFQYFANKTACKPLYNRYKKFETVVIC